MLGFYFHLYLNYLVLTAILLMPAAFLYLVLFLGFNAVFTSWKWVFQEPSVLHIAIAVFYLLFVSWLAVILFKGIRSIFKPDDYRVRIVPYFENVVTVEYAGKDHPFFYGRQICKNMRRLNRYAKRGGARKLSSYGFRDDRLSQRMKWYDPNHGLLTVNTILAVLKEDSGQRFTSKKLKLIAELELVQKWLLLAAKKNVRFALVTRMSHESELSWSYSRKGFFT